MNISFQGRSPVVAESAYIAPNATLVGGVTVGENSSIWFGAVARADFADISIGSNTNVQDNAVLHIAYKKKLTIGNNVTIGHGAIVHCAEVGDNCLIGMGSVLLSGAVIGEGSIIAAGAVVKENSVIPAGSLVVGVPGKVVRQVTPEQAEELKGPNNYYWATKVYKEMETEK